MLLDPEPLVVGYLGLGDLIFALAVHLEDRLVDLVHFGLIGCAILVPEMDLMLAIFTMSAWRKQEFKKLAEKRASAIV